MLIRAAIGAGVRKASSRSSLIVLLYLMGLALAALLAVPVFRAIDLLFGQSGFSAELATRFDVVVWFDMLEKGSSALFAAVRQAFWAVPLYVVWKTASQVGLIHALRGDANGGFWEGVGRHTLRALPIALAYLLVASIALAVLWTVLMAIIKGAGEVGEFWWSLVVGPLLTAMTIAQLDVMHDYARIHLVTRGGIWRSLIEGSIWPLKRLSALVMYDLWYFVAAVLWVLPFALDLAFPKITIGGMIGAFLLQQVAILARTAVSVGWIGSEVFYFEERAEPEPESVTGESESELPESERPTESNSDDDSIKESEEAPGGPGTGGVTSDTSPTGSP